MIEDIIDGISVALNSEFGDGYKTYTEEERQNMVDPCFFVMCLNPTHNLFLMRRYFRENTFVIQYFPQNKNRKREECNAVAERLTMCLEWITVTNDPVMASRMHYEIIDGVLNFFVNYNFFVRRNEDKTPMETLEINQNAKEVN